MMKFSVGERVIISNRTGMHWVSSMIRVIGKKVTIAEQTREGRNYRIKELPYFIWVENDFDQLLNED